MLHSFFPCPICTMFMASLFDERMKGKRDWADRQALTKCSAYARALGCNLLCDIRARMMHIVHCAVCVCEIPTDTLTQSVITVIRDARDIMVHDINIRLIYIFYSCISCSCCPFCYFNVRFVCNLFTMLIKNAFIELHRQFKWNRTMDATQTQHQMYSMRISYNLIAKTNGFQRILLFF